MSNLAQLTFQYRATGRIRRESQGQLGGGLGQSSLQVLTNSLVKQTKDTMDALDTMEADENEAKLKIRKLAVKMTSYCSSRLTIGTLP